MSKAEDLLARAHGALTDAGSVVVPGTLEGDLVPAIQQLVRERDELRDRVQCGWCGFVWDKADAPERHECSLNPLVIERDNLRAEVVHLRALKRGEHSQCWEEYEKAEAEVEKLKEAIGAASVAPEAYRAGRDELRAEAERLRADMVALTANLHARELDGYRKREAEIERLRAALGEITRVTSSQGWRKSVEVARAALRGGE